MTSTNHNNKQWIYLFFLLSFILVNEVSCWSRGAQYDDNHDHHRRLARNRRWMGQQQEEVTTSTTRAEGMEKMMNKKESSTTSPPTHPPATHTPSGAPQTTARPTMRFTFPPTSPPTFPPTFPPTSVAPTGSPPSLYPTCDICGAGLEMTNPDNVVNPPGINCGSLNRYGQSGLLSPNDCNYYQQARVRDSCGCKDPNSTSEPTRLPSSKPTAKPTANRVDGKEIELAIFALFATMPILNYLELKSATTAYLTVYFAARDDDFLAISLAVLNDDKVLDLIDANNTDRRRRKLRDENFLPNFFGLSPVVFYKSDTDRTPAQINKILVDALRDFDTLQPFLDYAMGDETPVITRVLFQNPPTPPTLPPSPTLSPTSDSGDENWKHCGVTEWCYLPRQECNIEFIDGEGLTGYCSCKPGYHNDNDDYCSTDLDECTEFDPHPCHSWAPGGYCVNSFPHQGEYTCSCDEGYIALDDLGHGPTKCLTPGSCYLNSFLCKENEECVRSDTNGQYYCE